MKLLIDAGCYKSAVLVAYRPVIVALLSATGAGGLIATVLVKWIS